MVCVLYGRNKSTSAKFERGLKMDDIIKVKKETNEMRILREFVEEYSPIHRGQTQDFSYDELFAIVSEIVDTHYERD